MRMRSILSVAALCASLAGTAFGQEAAAAKAPSTPSGLSLSFDAVHGQLSASGLAVKAKPAVVSPGTTVTGTVNITLTINLVSKFGRGVRIPCGAILIGGEVDTSVPVVDGGIETAANVASLDWKTKTATCTLSIPYEWTLANDSGASKGLIIGFAAAAVGWGDVTERSTIQIGGPVDLPASGTTTTLAYTTTL